MEEGEKAVTPFEEANRKAIEKRKGLGTIHAHRPKARGGKASQKRQRIGIA